MRHFWIFGAMMMVLACSLAGCGSASGIKPGMETSVQGPAPDVDLGQPVNMDMKGTNSAAASTGL